MKLSDRLFAGGRVRAGHRVSDGRARQGARADHRHRRAHERRAAVRARQVRESRQGTGADLGDRTSVQHLRLPKPYSDPIYVAPELLRRLHAGADPGGLPEALHARHARGVPLLHAPHRRRTSSPRCRGTGGGRFARGWSSSPSRCACRRRDACSTPSALFAAIVGALQLFRGVGRVTQCCVFPFTMQLPLPHWADGAHVADPRLRRR